MLIWSSFLIIILDLDGSFLSSNTNDSFSIPDAYFDAIGTRPAMPDFDYSSEYDPTIGNDDVFYYSGLGPIESQADVQSESRLFPVHGSPFAFAVPYHFPVLLHNGHMYTILKQ